LLRFRGEAFEESTSQLLKEKYRDKPVGVVVAVGTATLRFVLKWREQLWPNTPVVFTMVEASDFEQLKPPPDVTVTVARLPFADAVKAARAIVPQLETIVLVGGTWTNYIVFRNWKDDIQSVAAGLRVINMVGLDIKEARERVADLPDHSAII